MSRFTLLVSALALALVPCASAQTGNGSADAAQQEGILADFWVEPGVAASQFPTTAPGHNGDATAAQAENPDAEFVPGEILLAFHPGRGAAQAADAVRRGLGATKIKQFAQIGVHHWRLPPGLTVDQAVRALSANPNVKFAEPNYLVRAHVRPNDYYFYHNQWGMYNHGYLGGTVDADIDAPEAWDILTGSAQMVVGVIDTGIDYTHEDLVENIWINPGEVINGIDDDGNGYVDDVVGWDFVNNDNEPFDDYGHGTHVAGTIGAKGNNSIGVAGVNWTVQLMPLKFLNSSGSGSTDNAIEAVLYAAGFGVRVTNNSWGGGRKSRALEVAIESSGALFVASAGNDASNRKMYPAAYNLDNVISVAATDRNDQLASFSNYSDSWVDLGSPGDYVFSTVPMAGNCSWCYWRGYNAKWGTSMAAPYVAGVAALVMAHDPALDILAVKDRILSGVDPLASLTGKTLTGGRLNAFNALTGPPPPPPPPPGGVTVTDISPNWVDAGAMVGVTITGSGFVDGASVTFENGKGAQPIAANVAFVSSLEITATVTVGTNGPPRNRVWDVRVTNPDASTGTLAGGFTVIR